MDDSTRTLHCPQCENVVSDHAPGVSSVIVDGQHYHPGCRPRTWTAFVSVCRACDDRFRVSQEAIDETREAMDVEADTDSDIAESFDLCLQCCSGEIVAGEKDGLNANQ